MLKKLFYLLSLVIISNFISCNDNSTSSNDDKTVTLTDIDGNDYKTIKIGDQLWMAENLKVTHYRNGDEIQNVTDVITWSGLSTGAYCDYNFDIDNSIIYGHLYNWYAVSDVRNIAPEGWHVASNSEWGDLVNFLGDNAGGKLKDTTDWASPNTGATNESGFNGLPGGHSYSNGKFCCNFEPGESGDAGHHVAAFWTSTKWDDYSAVHWGLFWDAAYMGNSFYDMRWGMSIRCIKD